MSRYANATIALNDLIEMKAGISLAKKANHIRFGTEYAGPCPFCGGSDRFCCWPDPPLNYRPHYWCRGCGAEGSPAQFLMRYAGYSFGDALAELGLDDQESQPRAIRPIDPGEAPSVAWRDMGVYLLEIAEKYLWSGKPEALLALAYLRGRGFTDDIIRAMRIGFVPLSKNGRWIMTPFNAWGIDPDMVDPEIREKGGVRVPCGLLVPWFEGKTLWKLSTRRLEPHVERPWGQIYGSSDGLYNVDSLAFEKPCVIVESEFCALSIEQVAGDLVSPVATGSATKGHLSHWFGDIAMYSPLVLQSFDADEGGDNGAPFWLEALPGTCYRWEPWADVREDKIWFKDPNDMLRHAEAFKAFTGTDLRGWVQAGLEAAQHELIDFAKQPALPPPCIPHPADVRSGKVVAHPLAREGPVHVIQAPAQIYTEEERELYELLRKDYIVQLNKQPCLVCDCRLQHKHSGKIWNCAACIPMALWKRDLVARIRSARTGYVVMREVWEAGSNENRKENYWFRIRAKLQNYKAEVPPAFLEAAAKPRKYPAPFPAYQLVQVNGVSTLQTIGMWDPRAGKGLLEESEKIEQT